MYKSDQVEIRQLGQTNSILCFSDSAGYYYSRIEKKNVKNAIKRLRDWRPIPHARAHALYACCNVTYIFILHVLKYFVLVSVACKYYVLSLVDSHY